MPVNLILCFHDPLIVQPALFCVENPVLSYLLKIKPQGVRNQIELSIGANNTYIVLGPSSGLEAGHKYEYSIAAFSVIGNTTSAMSGKHLSELAYQYKVCEFTACTTVMQ